MSSGPLDDDMSDMVQDDMQRFRELQSKDMGNSVPAVLEMLFAGAAALVAVAWLISLYWVPEVIPSKTWMLGGALGVFIFGLPAGILYLGRRGGVAFVERLVQSLLNS